MIKRYVEKRSREAAQAQVTVTPFDTVQHCSPCPLNPQILPDVCMRLESNEGKMDPELKELESPLAGTGLETPGQQCPPNEGTWEKGRTIADDYLLVGMGSNQQGGDISFTHDRTRGHASRQNYGEHQFPAARPQTQRRGERQQRKQAI